MERDSNSLKGISVYAVETRRGCRVKSASGHFGALSKDEVFVRVNDRLVLGWTMERVLRALKDSEPLITLLMVRTPPLHHCFRQHAQRGAAAPLRRPADAGTVHAVCVLPLAYPQAHTYTHTAIHLPDRCAPSPSLSLSFRSTTLVAAAGPQACPDEVDGYHCEAIEMGLADTHECVVRCNAKAKGGLGVAIYSKDKLVGTRVKSVTESGAFELAGVNKEDVFLRIDDEMVLGCAHGELAKKLGKMQKQEATVRLVMANAAEVDRVHTKIMQDCIAADEEYERQEEAKLEMGEALMVTGDTGNAGSPRYRSSSSDAVLGAAGAAVVKAPKASSAVGTMLSNTMSKIGFKALRRNNSTEAHAASKPATQGSIDMGSLPNSLDLADVTIDVDSTPLQPHATAANTTSLPDADHIRPGGGSNNIARRLFSHLHMGTDTDATPVAATATQRREQRPKAGADWRPDSSAVLVAETNAAELDEFEQLEKTLGSRAEGPTKARTNSLEDPDSLKDQEVSRPTAGRAAARATTADRLNGRTPGKPHSFRSRGPGSGGGGESDTERRARKGKGRASVARVDSSSDSSLCGSSFSSVNLNSSLSSANGGGSGGSTLGGTVRGKTNAASKGRQPSSAYDIIRTTAQRFRASDVTESEFGSDDESESSFAMGSRPEFESTLQMTKEHYREFCKSIVAGETSANENLDETLKGSFTGDDFQCTIRSKLLVPLFVPSMNRLRAWLVANCAGSKGEDGAGAADAPAGGWGSLTRRGGSVSGKGPRRSSFAMSQPLLGPTNADDEENAAFKLFKYKVFVTQLTQVKQRRKEELAVYTAALQRRDHVLAQCWGRVPHELLETPADADARAVDDVSQAPAVKALKCSAIPLATESTLARSAGQNEAGDIMCKAVVTQLGLAESDRQMFSELREEVLEQHDSVLVAAYGILPHFVAVHIPHGHRRQFGLQLKSDTDRDRFPGALMVGALQPGSIAARNSSPGLQPGHYVLQVNGEFALGLSVAEAEQLMCLRKSDTLTLTLLPCKELCAMSKLDWANFDLQANAFVAEGGGGGGDLDHGLDDEGVPDDAGVGGGFDRWHERMCTHLATSSQCNGDVGDTEDRAPLLASYGMEATDLASLGFAAAALAGDGDGDEAPGAGAGAGPLDPGDDFDHVRDGDEMRGKPVEALLKKVAASTPDTLEAVLTDAASNQFDTLETMMNKVSDCKPEDVAEILSDVVATAHTHFPAARDGRHREGKYPWQMGANVVGKMEQRRLELLEMTIDGNDELMSEWMALLRLRATINHIQDFHDAADFNKAQDLRPDSARKAQRGASAGKPALAAFDDKFGDRGAVYGRRTPDPDGRKTPDALSPGTPSRKQRAQQWFGKVNKMMMSVRKVGSKKQAAPPKDGRGTPTSTPAPRPDSPADSPRNIEEHHRQAREEWAQTGLTIEELHRKQRGASAEGRLPAPYLPFADAREGSGLGPRMLYRAQGTAVVPPAAPLDPAANEAAKRRAIQERARARAKVEIARRRAERAHSRGDDSNIDV